MFFLPLMLGAAILQVASMHMMPIRDHEILRLSDQTVIREEQLVTALAGHRIVLIGEAHDNPAHHAVQLKMIQALHARHRELAVALEMFPRSLQPQLDRWVAGELSENAFLDGVEWYFTWGFDAELYMPIFRFARERRIPLLAMNLPRETVGKVRRKGMAELDISLRDTLPPICPASLAYRLRLEEVFNAHEMISKSGKFDHFVESQTLWDGVMADTLRNWSRSHPHGVVVGLAGTGHLLKGHGIPHQLRQRGVEDLVTLLPWTGADSWVDPDAADYVWGTPAAPESPPPMRLGVVLDERRSDGAWLKEVGEESPGARAGLKAGDQLLRLDDLEIRSRHALVRLLNDMPRDGRIRLSYRRDGQEREVFVSRPTPESHASRSQ
ncbi:MAG: ChaN family lipoprotein [Magnetococcales bacterium]|nr:ChaN family lipoprotein [Magnetococcales bacterium]